MKVAIVFLLFVGLSLCVERDQVFGSKPVFGNDENDAVKPANPNGAIDVPEYLRGSAFERRGSSYFKFVSEDGELRQPTFEEMRDVRVTSKEMISKANYTLRSLAALVGYEKISRLMDKAFPATKRDMSLMEADDAILRLARSCDYCEHYADSEDFYELQHESQGRRNSRVVATLCLDSTELNGHIKNHNEMYETTHCFPCDWDDHYYYDDHYCNYCDYYDDDDHDYYDDHDYHYDYDDYHYGPCGYFEHCGS